MDSMVGREEASLTRLALDSTLEGILCVCIPSLSIHTRCVGASPILQLGLESETRSEILVPSTHKVHIPLNSVMIVEDKTDRKSVV